MQPGRLIEGPARLYLLHYLISESNEMMGVKLFHRLRSVFCLMIHHHGEGALDLYDVKPHSVWSPLMCASAIVFFKLSFIAEEIY